MLDLIALIKWRGFFGEFFKSLGGFGGVRTHSRWSEYYACVACRAARECGWEGEPGADAVRQALSVVCPRVERRACRQPEKPPAPAIQPLIALYRWMSENICQAMAGTLQREEQRSKYVELLNLDAYRAYRVWIYRKLVAPLVRRGAESVLLVGAGVVEPFDLMKALNIEGLEGAVEITAQEVDPEAARALAASGMSVFLGEVEQMEDSFDVALVQNVLHWAERPEELLAAVAQRAKYVVLSQGYGYNNAAGFLLTAVLGAKRAVPSREYIDSVVAQAGLEPLRDMPSLKAYGLYVGVFKGRAEKK